MDPTPGRSPSPGRMLGHYRLLERIGQGGMGEVWRARDERLQRDVALKLLLPGTLADEASRKRFRREALALSQLSHPNIATVFDFDTAEDGLDFLVMEYVGGAGVTERLAEGPLPEAEVVRLGVQLAEGLAAAHARGIVHRDLKPGNVRLTPDGRLKILDFGLARLAHAADEVTVESLTRTEGLVGTLAYMAPEQLRGEPADARSDLWAAGLVLYELATGQRAFGEKQSAPLIHAILNQAPATLRGAHAAVSAGLESIILKGLERDPKMRYASADALAEDLRRLAGGLTVEAERQRVRARRRHALAGVLPAAAIALLALLLVLDVGGVRTRLFTPPPIRSIAVLPLVNLSGDAGQDYFADGMTEQLINDLGQVGSLRIISRTSVMQYKDTKKSLQQIAKELHVDAVVEGSVVQAGDRVRISAQLIHAAKDRQLWAQSYERELRDVLILQSEIARAIVAGVRAKVTPQQATRLASARPVNPEAYQQYLKGRQLVSVFTLESIREALACFHRAIELDPQAAYAHWALADAYLGAANVSLAPAAELVPKAREAALRAIALDEASAEAHAWLANVCMYEWDWEGADRESRRAVELNPNSGTALGGRSVFLQYVGRYDEAAEFSRRAHPLSPASAWDLINVAWNLVWARRYEEALEVYEEARRLDPGHPGIFMEKGFAYSMLGRHREAVEQCREAVRRAPDVDYLLACCGTVFARAGAERDAADALQKLRGIARTRYVDPFVFAWYYMNPGPRDSALFWLERSVAERSAGSCNIRAGVWPDSMRADPRFKALVKRVGLPPD